MAVRMRLTSRDGINAWALAIAALSLLASACGSTSQASSPPAPADAPDCSPLAGTGITVPSDTMPVGSAIGFSAYVEGPNNSCGLPCNALTVVITRNGQPGRTVLMPHNCSSGRALLQPGERYTWQWTWGAATGCTGDASCAAVAPGAGTYRVASSITLSAHDTETLGALQVEIAAPGAPSGGPYAAQDLVDATPDPWTGPDGTTFLGYASFTASHLNGTRGDPRIAGLTFVAANVPSTRPTEISVDAIGKYAWSAAAYSTILRACVVSYSANQESDPTYGVSNWGTLPPGAPCVATSATLKTATSEDEPDG